MIFKRKIFLNFNSFYIILGSKNDIQTIKNHPYFKDINWDKLFQ
jgi:hypothetical protein